MAQIILTIPDANINEVVDAFADQFNYTTSQLPGETKSQFAKRQVIEHIKIIRRNYLAKISADINIT